CIAASFSRLRGRAPEFARARCVRRRRCATVRGVGTGAVACTLANPVAIAIAAIAIAAIAIANPVAIAIAIATATGRDRRANPEFRARYARADRPVPSSEAHARKRQQAHAALQGGQRRNLARRPPLAADTPRVV